MRHHFIHPYMPNSVPHIEEEMLRELGLSSVEELYRTVIPEDLLFQGTMDLPAPLLSEQALKRHVSRLLAKNTSTEDAISFLGAGCYKRYIPAVCDEIANRSEFLTAYCGDTYSDHGKMQAIFEYASMMAELLELDVVSYPTYDAGQAVSSSFRMALRLRPGRNEILVPAHMNPEIRSQAAAYCRPFGTLVPVENPFGVLDLADLQAKLSPRTAAVFLENPAYLGAFEPRAKEIMDLAHQAGAIGIVMPEVSSLGVVTPPSGYGADITCGDIQPLGIHMQYGSGCGGFIAMDNDPDYVNELPTYLYGISETQKDGQYGWGRALYYRCSHASRENAKEYFGTECGLWAIVAGAYLAPLFRLYNLVHQHSSSFHSQGDGSKRENPGPKGNVPFLFSVFFCFSVEYERIFQHMKRRFPKNATKMPKNTVLYFSAFSVSSWPDAIFYFCCSAA